MMKMMKMRPPVHAILYPKATATKIDQSSCGVRLLSGTFFETIIAPEKIYNKTPGLEDVFPFGVAWLFLAVHRPGLSKTMEPGSFILIIMPTSVICFFRFR